MTTERNDRVIDPLMAYYDDPETDFPDAGELPEFKPFTAACPPDSRQPVIRLAALLLGLCVVTGAAAFMAATGGGAGWTVAVFGVLMGAFGLGVVAGSNRWLGSRMQKHRLYAFQKQARSIVSSFGGFVEYQIRPKSSLTMTRLQTTLILLTLSAAVMVVCLAALGWLEFAHDWPLIVPEHWRDVLDTMCGCVSG